MCGVAVKVWSGRLGMERLFTEKTPQGRDCWAGAVKVKLPKFSRLKFRFSIYFLISLICLLLYHSLTATYLTFF